MRVNSILRFRFPVKVERGPSQLEGPAREGPMGIGPSDRRGIRDRQGVRDVLPVALGRSADGGTEVAAAGRPRLHHDFRDGHDLERGFQHGHCHHHHARPRSARTKLLSILVQGLTFKHILFL